MQRIAANIEVSFQVRAAMADVLGLFADPRRLRELMDGIDHAEFGPDGAVHWILEEKNEKGIRFKGDYKVRYQDNGADWVSWTSLGGNMDNAGTVTLRRLGEHLTEVVYAEMVAPHLPISKLLALIVRPIVERELKADVGRYLERVRQYLERSYAVAS